MSNVNNRTEKKEQEQKSSNKKSKTMRGAVQRYRQEKQLEMPTYARGENRVGLTHGIIEYVGGCGGRGGEGEWLPREGGGRRVRGGVGWRGQAAQVRQLAHLLLLDRGRGGGPSRIHYPSLYIKTR